MEKILNVLQNPRSAVLLTPLLLFLSWPPLGLGFPSMLALVPLLLIARLELKKYRYFLIIYAALFLFNLLTTWWVKNASLGGALFMLFANTMLMCVPFLGYRFTLKRFEPGRALMAFVFYWLGFEYFHFNWEISFPWLTLGNLWAMHPEWVQWYQYTGVLGGSLWVLLINVLLAYAFMASPSKRVLSMVALMIIIPMVFSLFQYHQWKDDPRAQSLSVSIIQPNVDPYAKFNAGEELMQIERFVQLAVSRANSKADLYVLPETAIVEYLDENWIEDFQSIHQLRKWLATNPTAHLLTGASTYRFFDNEDERSVTARQSSNGKWYDSYNTALMMNQDGVQQTYHKSKLVPGVEKMPYPAFFRFLEPLAIDMGGITGSLGNSKAPVVFTTSSKNAVLTPLICYESIYGEYLTKFVQKGANLLAVITNDGWWGNTPGYKQHLHYARLRAVENRRYLIRSANTGISAIINARGDLLQRTKWWEDDVINADVKLLQSTTIYTRLGDYIGRFALFLGIFFFLGVWVKSKVNR